MANKAGTSRKNLKPIKKGEVRNPTGRNQYILAPLRNNGISRATIAKKLSDALSLPFEDLKDKISKDKRDKLITLDLLIYTKVYLVLVGAKPAEMIMLLNYLTAMQGTNLNTGLEGNYSGMMQEEDDPAFRQNKTLILENFIARLQQYINPERPTTDSPTGISG